MKSKLAVWALSLVAATGCNVLVPKMPENAFDDIETGMTYEQVGELLESEGKLISSADNVDFVPPSDSGIEPIAAPSSKVYEWRFRKGFGVQIVHVTFQNGEVAVKNQSN